MFIVILDKLVLALVLVFAGIVIESEFTKGRNKENELRQQILAVSSVYTDLIVDQRHAMTEAVGLYLNTIGKIEDYSKIDTNDTKILSKSTRKIQLIGHTISGVDNGLHETVKSLENGMRTLFDEIVADEANNSVPTVNRDSVNGIIRLYQSALEAMGRSATDKIKKEYGEYNK